MISLGLLVVYEARKNCIYDAGAKKKIRIFNTFIENQIKIVIKFLNWCHCLYKLNYYSNHNHIYRVKFDNPINLQFSGILINDSRAYAC